MTTTISHTRQQYIKQQRGRQLVRSLRRKFKTNDFKFEWAPPGTPTAYWDGESMFVRYDVENFNPTRHYTMPERFAIQAGLAYHEMGHKLYDDMNVYRQMIKDHSSNDADDWINNRKWPRNIVSQISNAGADGRLEHFLKIEYPFTADAIDYVNYEWCFANISNLGESKVNDFFACLLLRLLQMVDDNEYLPEAVQLVDDNQAMIDRIILQRTTKDNLTATYDLLREVWPTIYEWMQDEKQDPSEFTTHFVRLPHEESEMESSPNEDIEEHLERVMELLEQQSDKDVQREQESDAKQTSQSEKDDDSDEKQDEDSSQQDDSTEGQDSQNVQPQERSKPSFDNLLETTSNEMKNVEEQVDEQIEVDSEPSTTNFISIGGTNIKGKIIEEQVPNLDVEHFYSMYEENRLKIKGLSKSLRLLLQPVSDEEFVSTKGKRIKTNLIWRATQCNDNKIYRRKIDGKPAGDVFMGCMTDVSGSTYAYMSNGKSVVENMKDALTVVLSAADENQSRISTEAYAFHTDFHDDTTIYQLKNKDKLSLRTKGAIGGLCSGNGNRDVVALQYLLDKTKAHSESIKLAIMLSDGAPIFAKDESVDLMKDMIAKAKKQGIDVVCLFVGENEYGYKVAKEIYGNNVIHCDKQLVKDFKNVILRIIKLRRG